MEDHTLKDDNYDFNENSRPVNEFGEDNEAFHAAMLLLIGGGIILNTGLLFHVEKAQLALEEFLVFYRFLYINSFSAEFSGWVVPSLEAIYFLLAVLEITNFTNRQEMVRQEKLKKYRWME